MVFYCLQRDLRSISLAASLEWPEDVVKREEVKMTKIPGSFLVLFRPGVVSGIHNEREVVLRKICESLGGLDLRVFDPYLVYAGVADCGMLVRVEQRNIYGFAAVSFFYADSRIERETRKILINRMLDEVKTTLICPETVMRW